MSPAWPGGLGCAGQVTSSLLSTWCLQVGWGGVLGAPGAAGPSILWRDRRRLAGCAREECARLGLVNLLLPPVCWMRSCRGHRQERLAQGEASSSRLLTPWGAGRTVGHQAVQDGRGVEVSVAGLRATHGQEPKVIFLGLPRVLPRGRTEHRP